MLIMFRTQNVANILHSPICIQFTYVTENVSSQSATEIIV